MSRAAVFLAEGFETVEALAVVDICRRAGIDTVTISVSDDRRVSTSHGILVEADELIADTDLDSFDMLILPGGMPGTENLEKCTPLMDKLDEFNAAERYISAICAAPRILGKKGFLKGRRATCFPGVEGFLEGAVHTGSKVEADGHFITGRGMGTAIEFALAIVERLEGKEKAQQVAEKITFA